MKYASETGFTAETLQFKQEIRSRKAVHFLTAVGLGFGLLLIFGGFIVRLPRVGADEWAMLVLGCAVGAITLRLRSIALGPSIIITADRIIVRTWIRNRVWKISDITELVSFPTTVQARVNGVQGPKVPVHYLGLKTRQNRSAKFVLPQFRGNEDLLTALAMRANIEIGMIAENNEPAFKQWLRNR